MNILVTGHSGFLGGAIANSLANWHMDKHRVYGVSRFTIPDCSYHQFSADINDSETIRRLVSEKAIDMIVHTAAKPIVSDCDKDPYAAFEVNMLGTVSVLEAARRANVKKVICIQTDKVYGYQTVMPTPETAVLNPGSPYEASKAMGAQICELYRNLYDMNIIGVRPVNIFGPGDKAYSRIIPGAMKAFSEGRGITVYSNAVKMKREFIYIYDVVEMIERLLFNDTKEHTYNFSSGVMKEIGAMAEEITDICGHSVRPVIIEKPGTFSEIPDQVIDGSRFNKEFPDHAYTFFDAAIKETFKRFMNE